MTNPETHSARAAITLGLLGVSVLVVGGALISVYASGDPSFPAGADTPWYVWRAKLVAGLGLEALPGSVPPPLTAKASRAGYPVVAGFLDTVAGVAPLRLAFALPSLMGILVGLGAGAFAVRGLREPRWAFPIHAVVVGASANVVLTAVSHADNLIVLAVVASAAAAAMLAADGRAGLGAAVVLLAGGSLIHWPFTLLFGGIVAGAGALLLPESLAARRGGSGLLATPSGRLGAVVAGSAAVGAVVLALAPAAPNLPQNFESRVSEKLSRDAPEFLALSLPAAVGAVALLRPGDPARRRGLLLALVWAGSAVAGVVALAVLPIPAHRILFFAAGIPILAAAAVVWVARTVASVGPVPVGRAAAAILTATLLAGAVILSLATWRPVPDGRLGQVAAARTAGRYLTAVGGDLPVVFVIGSRSLHSPRNVIRAALPPNQIRRAHVYIGEADRLLAGGPTVVPGNERYNETSRRQFAALAGVLEERPIVVWLAAFDRQGARPPEGAPVAPGVVAVRGPVPPAGIEQAPPPRPATPWELAGIVARSLALFAVVGLGWAVSLLPRGWLTRLSIAPALGLALLALGGVLAARVGAGGPGARPWIAASLALAGWGPAAWRRWRPSGTRGGT